jgi:hypothetical protein
MEIVMTERVTGPASYFPSIEKKYGKRHRRSGTRPAKTTN